jgi:hypothetical protein
VAAVAQAPLLFFLGARWAMASDGLVAIASELAMRRSSSMLLVAVIERKIILFQRGVVSKSACELLEALHGAPVLLRG